MSVLTKINHAEKDKYCENIYEKYIVQTSDFLGSCERAGLVIRAYIPRGCYTNFRDVLFHFRRMANATESSEITCQAFAIKEHANRAKTDAVICLLDSCADIIEIIINENDLSEEIRYKLETQLNILRESLMNYRLGGMMLENADLLKMTEESFLNILEEYFKCIDIYVSDKFKEVVGRIRKQDFEKENEQT